MAIPSNFKFIASFFFAILTMLSNSGCIITEQMYKNLGKQTESVARYNFGVVTDDLLFFNYTATSNDEQNSVKDKAIENIDRWVSLIIEDILNTSDHLEYEYLASPLSEEFIEKETKIPISIAISGVKGCEDAVDKFMVVENTIVGSLPISTGQKNVNHRCIKLPLIPNREYRKIWAYPALVVLTPITIAVDILAMPFYAALVIYIRATADDFSVSG